MFKKISFIFIALFASTTFAQTICKQTTVYFDFGKFDLNESEARKIDSIVALIPNEFMVELSGHTDSVDTESYNLVLSENRVEAVFQYINQKKENKISFKKQFFGKSNPIVPNSSDSNRALNRRVEISLIPLDSGKIIFGGAKGEQALLDTAYFNDCEICDLKHSFVSYATEQEANAAGLELLTDDGRELVTGGMMQFTLDGCEQLKDTCFNVELSMPSTTIDSTMTAWDLNENGRWVDSENMSIVRSREYCSVAGIYCFGRGRGIGKMINCDVVVVKSCEKKSYINKYYNNYKFKIDSNEYKTELIVKDTFPIIFYCDSIDTLKVLANIDNQFYYLKMDRELFYSQFNEDSNLIIIDSSYLLPILTNDTIIKLKIKGKKLPQKVGFQNQEFEHFIKIDQIKKRKFKSNYLDFPHKLNFAYARNKKYLFEYEDVNSKFKKKKSVLKIKVKKKHFKNFEEIN